MFTCASINVFEYFRRIFPRTQLCSSYKNNYLWSLELLSNWKIKSAAPALIDGSETINYRGENGRKYIKAKTHFSCHVSFKSFLLPVSFFTENGNPVGLCQFDKHNRNFFYVCNLFVKRRCEVRLFLSISIYVNVLFS